jgi:glycosyltransferase domain-containing protein
MRSKAQKVFCVTPRLTILMPLKGRHRFTLRFLWHANKVRLPHRFLLADGEVRPGLAKILEDPQKTFPALDLEYVRYPDDLDFRRYYAKMADALRRVRTPYVKIADNDDFLAPSGIECCSDFLDAHPDYICCSGGIGGFSLHVPRGNSCEMVTGQLNKLNYRFSPRDRSIDLDAASPTERVLAGLRDTWNHYAVFRAPALALIWKEILEINPTNLQLAERFLTMRTLTLGKARSDGRFISYLRQYWTSLQVHWIASRLEVRKSFVHYLLRSRFTEDVANVIDRISRPLAEIDSNDPAAIAELLRERLEEWVDQMIRLDYGTSATLRRYLRTHHSEFVAWLKQRRRLRLIFERRGIFNKLREHGATAAYLTKFSHELGQIEEVLTGREFKVFLGGQMPHNNKAS